MSSNKEKCRYQCGDFCLVESQKMTIQRLEDELTQLKAQGEPVAWKYDEAVPVYATEEGYCTTPYNKKMLTFDKPDLSDPYIHHVIPLYTAPPLREGWVMATRYATQKQINATAKLDLPNTPYCEIYSTAIAASEEGRK